jgi:MoaA/NifB/PqqE/SkfB family radical SAM enzyme
MWVDDLGKILFQVPDIPSQVQLEVNNACNLDCAMCPRHELPIELNEMPFELFCEVIDQLHRLKQTRIDLGGWGELTHHSRFCEIVRYAADKGMEISLTTNGLLLKKERLQTLLDSSVKDITLSIDSLERRKKDFTGHINNPVWKNLEELLSYKDSHNLRIRINTLIQKSNRDEIFEIIDAVDKLGVYMHVLFGPNIARDDAGLRVPYSEERALYKEIEAQRSKGRWQCVVSTPLARYKSGTRKHYFGLGGKCPQTFESFYVNLKGEVTPCTLLPDTVIGKLSEFDTLEALWKSSNFQAFRRDQERICQGCDALKFETHDG